ncbi:MAG: SpoIIE family protein phosphatase [Bacteroidota bacterium]|nr:SpoIIE family protein phosphatase [Bacteroidota bacterium]
MENYSQEQLLLEKEKLNVLKLEFEEKNKQMWAMSEAVYKEKKKIEEQLHEILSQKSILETQKNENETNVKLLWEQSAAIHKEKERIETLKKEVEQRHQEVLDSVHYAKRIQLAILPTEEMVKTLLPDSFIFFKPKNIVSGDFYWVKQLSDGKILFAAVDCTGHGVPGAFMSILGYNLLEQTLKDLTNYNPATILTELCNAIIKSLKQTQEFESVKDGMDIALCLLDLKKLKIEFAGAHNPLYIIRNGELMEFKADNRAIGFSYFKKTSFQNHEVDIKKGDCLYIFSDGFVDQKGGPNKTKFFYTPFKQLLIDIHQNPMEEQRQLLDDKFMDWKKELSQIDDVLIFGVKV